MKHHNKSDNYLSKIKPLLATFIENQVSDTELIKARLKVVVADTELFKKILLASGVYDRNFKPR